MPGWLKNYITFLAGPVAWLLRWGVIPTVEWVRWVNSSIHGVVRFSERSYVLLTYDIANFSYYVATFSRNARQWVVWLAYQRIPRAYRLATRYARNLVALERKYRKQEIAQTIAFLLKVINRVYLTLLRLLDQEIANRKAAITALRAFLLQQINIVYRLLSAAINQERQERIKAIADLRAWAVQQFDTLWKYARSILPTVDKEAAGAYDGTLQDQANGLSRLVDDLAADNPVMRDIVGKLAGLILDLISVDDPAARILGQLLLRQVIDRLGVDKLAGGLADDLLSVFLGGGKPKTLADVMTQIGDRLNVGESQWSQFYANGGDDLENLGTQMRKSAAPVFTLAMAGYFAACVIDPQGTAAVTDATVTPAAGAIVRPLLAVLGG